MKTIGSDPSSAFVVSNDNVAPGLTKREYFAAMALQGLATKYGESGVHYDSAGIAVQFADQLIEALNK